MTAARASIVDAINDPAVFGPWFKDRETWAAWFAFIAAMFALPMTAEQRAIYQACTGRVALPREPFLEAWLVCGRRAGKSFVLALLAVFTACFRDWLPYLQPGERATVLVIAADRKQARAIMRFVKGLLNGIPMLSPMIERETAESIDLTNNVTIEIATASFRRTRGYAICAALLDELAFWPSEDSASPDFEVIDAIRPGMAQFPDPLLLCASSPYARRGALWDAYRKYFGKEDQPVLVWQAETRRMNPTVPQSVIDQATERDPASALAEYGAQFRTDIADFISRVAIDACVDDGVHERPPSLDIAYVAFCDPSGGSSDSMTLAIAHLAGVTSILDAVREVKPPFSPEATVSEFGTLLKSYRINTVEGDRWGSEWVVEQFRKVGIHYRHAAKTKSELCLEALPQINSHGFRLLDHSTLVNQLLNLERRTSRIGKDTIDHAPGSHDDVANAALGALVLASTETPFGTMTRKEREELAREQGQHDREMADPLAEW